MYTMSSTKQGGAEVKERYGWNGDGDIEAEGTLGGGHALGEWLVQRFGSGYRFLPLPAIPAE
jgi:hypothetical protein